MDRTNKSTSNKEITMSNSSRIEVATRKHVGATLTGQMINELVKVSFPDWKGGVYPSDAAYVRKDGQLIPRGKTAYGDGVLEYLAENSFKVLPTEEIVRKPTSRKQVAPAVAPAAPVVKTEPEKKVSKKKASNSASQPPVAPKSKGADRHAAV
jgi:hypothetical protein